ncbi:MAG: Sua5/YciO/YrdC/YwlC family protein [Nocardiopsaceae bacterium]|nr:Sua5/YciO/YrdC/YwlC family protein [Nocardiopsaceae bacterium]
MDEDITTAAPYWRPSEVDDALATLRRGGLILVKGDIGYGLFGITKSAISKMYEAKGRSLTNPCIFIGSLDVLDEIAVIERPEVREWIGKTAAWTTLAVVLPARMSSPCLAEMDPWVRERSVTNGSLAVFLRTGPYIDDMVARAFGEGWVFVGSSANRSHTGNVYRFADIPPEVMAAADLAVNHGTSAHINDQRLATTMINFTNWSIRRAGVNYEPIRESFDELRQRVVS